MNNLNDPNKEEKIHENQDVFMEDHRYRDKLKEMSFFRINEYINQKPNELIFMSKQEFKNLDLNINLDKTRIKI